MKKVIILLTSLILVAFFVNAADSGEEQLHSDQNATQSVAKTDGQDIPETVHKQCKMAAPVTKILKIGQSFNFNPGHEFVGEDIPGEEITHDITWTTTCINKKNDPPKNGRGANTSFKAGDAGIYTITWTCTGGSGTSATIIVNDDSGEHSFGHYITKYPTIEITSNVKPRFPHTTRKVINSYKVKVNDGEYNLTKDGQVISTGTFGLTGPPKVSWELFRKKWRKSRGKGPTSFRVFAGRDYEIKLKGTGEWALFDETGSVQASCSKEFSVEPSPPPGKIIPPEDPTDPNYPPVVEKWSPNTGEVEFPNSYLTKDGYHIPIDADSQIPYPLEVVYRIITHNTPARRNLLGKLSLDYVKNSGNSLIAVFNHAPKEYKLGEDINVDLGVHQGGGTKEYSQTTNFEIRHTGSLGSFKIKGICDPDAEYKPDPDGYNYGDGVPSFAPEVTLDFIRPNIDIDGREPDANNQGSLVEVADAKEDIEGVLISDNPNTEIIIRNPKVKYGKLTLTWGKENEKEKIILVDARGREFHGKVEIDLEDDPIGDVGMTYRVKSVGTLAMKDSIKMTLKYSLTNHTDTITLRMCKIELKEVAPDPIGIGVGEEGSTIVKVRPNNANIDVALQIVASDKKSEALFTENQTTSLKVSSKDITNAKQIKITGMKIGNKDGLKISAYTIDSYSNTVDKNDECASDLFSVDVTMSLIPDYNRDGAITNADAGKVTKVKPWRFWINDDDDSDSNAETGMSEDFIFFGTPDDLPGQDDQDHLDKKVNGIRDLIDFFPLKVDIRKALKAFPSSTCKYYLESDVPAKFFMGCKKDHSGSIKSSAVDDPLKLISTALKFKNEPVDQLGIDRVELDDHFLNHYPDKIIYVEADLKSSPNDCISLIVEKNGVEVLKTEFPVQFTSVKQMFKQKDFRGQMGADDVCGDRLSITNKPYNMLNTGADKKSIIWVHGYNNTPDDATATFAEVFKRLYHQGLKGDFIGVSWYGDPKNMGSLMPSYHECVVNSFYAAELLGAYVKGLPGKKYLVGHSMGNMVVSAAIQNHLAKDDYEKYFAVDAAVPLEAYGATKVNESMLSMDDNDAGYNWLDYYNNVSSRKVVTSEWYKLFLNGRLDYRSELTWRDRLKRTVTDGKMVNFFSSTEEVLRKFEGDNFIWVSNKSGVSKYLEDTANKKNFYSWVKQEKFKGQRSKLHVRDELAGASSDYCGWRYSNAYKNWIWSISNLYLRKYSPNEAAQLTDEQLRTEPFFEIGGRKVWDGQSLKCLLENTEITVNGTKKWLTPSEFVDQTLGDLDDYKDYDFENDKVKTHVRVRDWLLAVAFPATTLPMGANPLGKASDPWNIDMSTKCKANVSNWPSKRIDGTTQEWYHSDYKDLSYQFTFPFYKEIAQRINK